MKVLVYLTFDNEIKKIIDAETNQEIDYEVFYEEIEQEEE